ncbi:M48 family metallopeptidase [Reinekea marina]|uniref:M48 family metallopeptidase n=1 Tax=Reinekea marina TaxID=1310421 RepID=A0ABV7WSV1_9GAMM|nr:M48 family metallopeptidase [Reinekea marina]MDN3647627.1 M48 family metallopeptidase [Reinekea marina]
MMPNENPRIPEGINVSKSHPIKDLLMLSFGVAVIFTLVALALWMSLTFLVQFVPLSWEKRIADPIVASMVKDSDQQANLQVRLDRILAVMGYHGEAGIQIHLIESPEVNAFATLGGHIFILTGLLESIDSDIGLDMVIAHEAAHILNRDPIQAASGMLGISLATAIITGNENFAQANGLISVGNQMIFLNHSRAQEKAADQAALNALKAIYSEINGAEELFVKLLESDHQDVPVIFSSHPHPQARIDAIRAMTTETPTQ